MRMHKYFIPTFVGYQLSLRVKTDELQGQEEAATNERLIYKEHY